MQHAKQEKEAVNNNDSSKENINESDSAYPLNFLNIQEMPSFCGPHKPLEESEEDQKKPSDLDRMVHAWMGKMTGGMSPASLILAYQDWLLHMSAYPKKQQDLTIDAASKAKSFWNYVAARMLNKDCEACIEAEEKDNRFEEEAWQQMPFDFYKQGFLLAQDWFGKATNNIHGVSKHHTEIVNFMTRQWLDMVSPANFISTNPEVIKATLDQNGENLIKGARNAIEDMQRFINNKPKRGTENFELGKDLATCEGKVVYRNYLFELIQYSPKTKQVYPEPVLIVPAWIMKYYILDLSPENSMVKYLLEKGHSVFMISWKNPDKGDANLGLHDYLKDGVMQATEAISDIVPDQKIQAVGYCIGGTLLSIAAAHMANKNIDRLKSLTLFTTQVDFEEAGELLMFVDESQLAYLEDLMWEQGYLKEWQLSGAFNMLRSKDLIWSRVVKEYLLGKDAASFDLLAWNADATRLPYKMHSEYLRSLYLNNDLAEHRYKVDGNTVNLSDIKIPVFAVATQKDHIAPWRSVFKLHELLDTELTFVLTKGGHNAGIVSEPGHEGRKFQLSQAKDTDGYVSANKWLENVEEKNGSWWPDWQNWLKDHSGNKVKAPDIGAPSKGYKQLEDAPGTYVHMR